MSLLTNRKEGREKEIQDLAKKDEDLKSENEDLKSEN
jgi:FtsZ-binding cell division protein ZapB